MKRYRMILFLLLSLSLASALIACRRSETEELEFVPTQQTTAATQQGAIPVPDDSIVHAPIVSTPHEDAETFKEAPSPSAISAFYAEYLQTIPNLAESTEFDLDHDGVNEMIIKTGAFEAEYEYLFFSYENDQVVEIGREVGSHSYLASDGSHLIVAGGQMGFEWAYRITYTDHKFSSELLFEQNIGDGEYTQWSETVSVTVGTSIAPSPTTGNPESSSVAISSRANGVWNHSFDITSSQQLQISSDGTFYLSYIEYGEVKELIIGTYKITDDDGQYQTFCFTNSNDSGDIWTARIWQTTVEDTNGTTYDGISYITETGEIILYSGVKWLS